VATLLVVVVFVKIAVDINAVNSILYDIVFVWTDGSGNTAGLSVLYSNRAACLMKLGDCQGCIADCDSALALCPDSPKPLLRRAMAFEALEK